MYLTLKSNRFQWIKDKAIYLLIPHFVFNVLYYFASATGMTIFDNMTKIFSFPQWLKEALLINSGEWFLWVLFSSFMLLLLVNWVEGKIPRGLFLIFIAVFTTLFLLMPDMEKDYLRLYEVQWYFLFALAGYLLAKYRELTARLFALAIAGAISYPAFMYLLDLNIGTALFPFHSFSGYLDINLSSAYLLRFLQAVAGICLVLLAATALGKRPRLAAPFAWLGRIAIGVYLFHMLFPGLHVGSGWLAVASAFIFSLSLAIGLTLVCIRVSVLNRLWLKGVG